MIFSGFCGLKFCFAASRHGYFADTCPARHGHAMSAASAPSSAKFLKFSRAMYRNAAYAFSVQRERFGGIFKNFIDPEFKRSENFRGFKFEASSIESAPWSR